MAYPILRDYVLHSSALMNKRGRSYSTPVIRALNASVTLNGQSDESDNNRPDDKYAKESRWHSNLVSIHHICHVMGPHSEFSKSDNQTHQERHDCRHIKSKYVGCRAYRKAGSQVFFCSSISHRDILLNKG